MPQNIPLLSFNINGLNMEYVTEFNFLGLIFDSNLNWKAHINFISVKIGGVIGLLHRLKFLFPKQILFSIYNSLILPHMSYSLLDWGTQCNKIELLQKKAVRVPFSTFKIAHTEPILKKMNQLKLTDMYTYNFLKLYYKLYRSKLSGYFDNFLPAYGVYRHNLHNDLIRLPAIRCDLGEMNSKYQVHYRLRELASPSNPPHFPPLLNNEDTLNKSPSVFSNYLKLQFIKSYLNVRTIIGCFV